MKVVIDAYSGKMTFYDADPSDPILQAYSAAFPNMFVPNSEMPASLQAHLRYPPDIFSIQSAIYGRYHLTNSGQFYAASNAWQLSPTAGAGPQSQALLAQNTYNNQGQLVSTNPARMSPQYQVYSLPEHGSGQTGLHGLGRLRPCVAIEPVGVQPELQPDRVDGRPRRPGTVRPAQPLRGPAGHGGPGQRGRGDLSQQDGVVGHHAAGPARVRGPAGGDAHGPDRQFHRLSAAAVRVADDQPAATAAIRGGRARARPCRSTPRCRPSCPTS